MSYALPFKVAALATAITLTACGGDSSSSKADGLRNNSEGTSVISAKGGDGMYRGNYGGSVSLEKSSSYGQVTLSNRGTPDADYDLPDYEVNLGSNPLTVSSSVTIKTYSSEDTLESGDVYYYGSSLYRYDGDTEEDSPVLGKLATLITGIEIAEGATLTLATDSSTAYLYLPNDIVNNGAITTANALEGDEVDSDLRPHLNLNPFVYSGTGSIELNGQSAEYPDARDLNINAMYIFNAGAINASGADVTEADAVGGEGGSINLNGEYAVENTGAITANAGDSAEGSVNEGGDVYISSEVMIANTGAISLNGGTGDNLYSSNEAQVYFYSPMVLINTGDISALGANAVNTEDGSSGGEGGYVTFEIEPYYNEIVNREDARLINTGSINVSGGSAAGDYTGGDGGYISFNSYEADNGFGGEGAAGMFAVTGNLIADGYSDAAGYRGGNGGYISFNHDATSLSEYETLVVGYQSIDVSGGNGATGYPAGSVNIYAESNEMDNSYAYAPTAPVAVSTSIIAEGGDAVYNTEYGAEGGSAGAGGSVSISSYTESYFMQAEVGETPVTFEGDLSLSGGNATGFTAEDVDGASGASGGSFYLSGLDDVEATGTLNSDGGSAEGTATTDTYYSGNEAGDLYAWSFYGNANINMDISMNGGNGGNNGGWAGFIFMNAAERVSLRGDLSLAGGNADASIEDTEGGFAGQAYLYSGADRYSSVNDDAVLTAGTGETAGLAGGITTGAQCALGNCVQYNWLD
ncbi:hypothetical protein [uncultured Thalassolituus sp.]|uniref:hypothetical protein n=1 Tax=uncultured Thalassolituus sp. TaxID=285273 RepID=UPI002613E4BB|nr:hypothetical protein [uncultured Thalassolituus sp.]